MRLDVQATRRSKPREVPEFSVDVETMAAGVGLVVTELGAAERRARVAFTIDEALNFVANFEQKVKEVQWRSKKSEG